MSIRPKPYEIKWPLTSNQAEWIDDMFVILFKAIKGLTLAVSSLSSTPKSTTSPLLIPGIDGMDGEDGIPGVPGGRGIQGVPGSFIIGQDGIDGEDGISIPGPPGPAGTGGGSFSEFTTTSTGNIDDLNFSNASVIRVNNATLSTIRGLQAGVAGQQVTIVSVGAGQVNLSHQDAGDGTAANRLINCITSGATPLSPGSGTAIYEYDATTARWRLIHHTQGAPITDAFASGHYVGGGAQTWTVIAGNVTVNQFVVIGHELQWTLALDNTNVSGTPDTRLIVTLPGGYSGLVSGLATIGQVLDNNNSVMGTFTFSGTTCTVRILAGGNWQAAVNSTATYLSFVFGIT